MIVVVRHTLPSIMMHKRYVAVCSSVVVVVLSSMVFDAVAMAIVSHRS